MKWFLMAAIFVCGCVSFPQAQVKARHVAAAPVEGEAAAMPGYTDSQCYDLMKARDNWMFAAKLLGGLGGAGAITTPMPQWSDEVRWGIGAGAAALTLTGAASAWVGESKSRAFEENCVVE